MVTFRSRISIVVVALVVATMPTMWAPAAPAVAPDAGIKAKAHSLRLAIQDLIDTFGPKYPHGKAYLQQLDAVVRRGPAGRADLEELRSRALLANPLLDFDHLLVIRRRVGPGKGKGKNSNRIAWTRQLDRGTTLGFPSNHECNNSLPRTAWDNDLAVVSPPRPGGTLTTLYRPPNRGYVGEVDLHWDADRLLLSRSDADNWKVFELRLNAEVLAGRRRATLRQVSRMPDDIDSFDACYLPDGRIVFGSTAPVKAVPCWHGQRIVTNLYQMDAEGKGVRQLCFDQDHDFHPVVLNDGQVLYHRWDYTGINHIFMRQLMVMNPDGTGQRAVYGSNSWFPNSLYFPRPVPHARDLVVTILSGYHGVHRMGRLVLIDTSAGTHGADGIVHEFPRRGRPIATAVRDNLVDKDWPKFLHPWPLSDKYILTACQPTPRDTWGIYLVDVFDNLVPVRVEDGAVLLEPVPVTKRPLPPAIPDRIIPGEKFGTVYLHNVYAGPGLAGVPKGTIKKLRVLAYHFGYPGMAGPDKAGYGGPWEVMRIVGTVGLSEDGSAFFRAPANTPLAVQPLDAEGKAVQLMRSWFTVMPGEVLSCVGCHERVKDVATYTKAAALRTPQDIRPWHGPARGFDFAREVQPVIDRHCVGCHDGSTSLTAGGRAGRPDLRRRELVKDYRGLPLSNLGAGRLHPSIKAATHGVLKYAPAYDALIAYIRRVGIEDDVSLLTPGEYHADTSPLVQMLRKGHHGVRLGAEDWDRLVTWIDLNAPCHGTWGEVWPIPDGAHERRMALRRRFGGPTEDFEKIPPLPPQDTTPVAPAKLPKPKPVHVAGWPFDAAKAKRMQAKLGSSEMMLDLGRGLTMKLVRIPAGEFAMGDPAGEPDEVPLTAVTIDKPFWMGTCEVTNAQFRRFDASHDPRYYAKRHGRPDDQGLALNHADQPAVRVSWRRAMAFCEWLSRRTGKRVSLPTEAQWEWACRAGSAEAMSFGPAGADFTKWANLGDRSFRGGAFPLGKQVTGGVQHLALEGAGLADVKRDDKAIVTAPVGRYKPNAWGARDMHGNAAEWTRTLYRPYPYRAGDGRNDTQAAGRRVVRGGSFFDPPRRARSAYRLAYPAWQRVFNVGFRVIVRE